LKDIDEDIMINTEESNIERHTIADIYENDDITIFEERNTYSPHNTSQSNINNNVISTSEDLPTIKTSNSPNISTINSFESNEFDNIPETHNRKIYRISLNDDSTMDMEDDTSMNNQTDNDNFSTMSDSPHIGRNISASDSYDISVESNTIEDDSSNKDTKNRPLLFSHSKSTKVIQYEQAIQESKKREMMKLMSIKALHKMNSMEEQERSKHVFEKIKVFSAKAAKLSSSTSGDETDDILVSDKA
jgi:hypothetical protein